MNWSELFFRLHHYCNLSKWEIWEYTLPQITELIMMTNKHIEFQVQVMTAPLGMFGGGVATSKEDSSADDVDYHEVTEEDVGMLAKAFGG